VGGPAPGDRLSSGSGWGSGSGSGSGSTTSELLDVARAAAEVAGALLLERFAAGAAGAVTTKSSPTDPVSEADEAAERAIREVLASRRPDDAVVGEEGDDVEGRSGLRWVVDPLDGTVNYLYGFPVWTVTMACQDASSGETLAGVVFDPGRSELFAATADGPWTRNGAVLSVPERATSLAKALVGTGFGYSSQRRAREGEIAARVLTVARDLRRTGSAAMDLAWTACGRLDAFYERGLNPWDAAAGMLICARAGLEVRTLAPREGLPGGVLVAPAAIADELEAVVG
jgi:myo-inositol-1(or 4)-monophosphatase